MTSSFLPSNARTLVESPIRGLYVTQDAPLPFLAGVVVRSFVLKRKAGNVIVCNSPGIDLAREDILALGQPDRLLVTHWHEALVGAPATNVPIHVHEKDRDRTTLPIAGTFGERHTLDGDLEIIPTPGHTAGSTSFLWNTGEHRLLFPGDTVWVPGGEWKAVLLAESDREAYIESLRLLMDLDFDVLVPWGGESGQPYAYPVGREDATQRLSRIVDRLRSGENA